jgi:ribosomal protein S3
MASTPYQLRLLTGSLKRFRWYRVNEFFSSTIITLQFSMAVLNTSLLSQVIANLLRKHNRHWLIFRFLKNLMGTYYNNNKRLQGVKIQISGKINGFSRKRRRVLSWGTLPLQTITNDIDYSYRVVITKFGVFGVKVWLYKV